MPYIGTQPLTGQFKKLDAISVVNGQAAYTLNHNGAAYKPATANALLVSVNGVIQAAGDAFTISGSTITFTENLVTGDVIDFIIALGDTGSAVTPVDGSVTTAKLGDGSVTNAKIDTMAASKLTGALPAIDGSSLTGINTGFTFPATQTLNGQSSRTFTGIPSGVNIIKFGVWRSSGTATAAPKIRIGDSGGIETTGYVGIDTFASTGGSAFYGGTGQTDAWGPSSWTSDANILMFQGELFRVHGNKWTCDTMVQQHNPGYFIRFSGYKELSGELTQFQFLLASGTFDDSDSYIRIAYQ